MIISVIGSGGKTTKIKQLKDQYLKEGKSVLMTTSTHMKIEEKTLVDPSYEEIINEIKKHGYVHAGSKAKNQKIKALDDFLYYKDKPVVNINLTTSIIFDEKVITFISPSNTTWGFSTAEECSYVRSIIQNQCLEIESYEKLVDLVKTKKEVEEELDLIKDKLRKYADGEKLDWAFPDLKINVGLPSIRENIDTKLLIQYCMANIKDFNVEEFKKEPTKIAAAVKMTLKER